ncbi:GSU3473 family protein [Trichloromonas sp.]|uniref:GSU3473 family protein n=1 Tax=Trichloromonas sp. TaxID=3069249 RepID=UPI003D81BE70
MLIRVKYPDGRYDMVKNFRLDHLIETRAIYSFKRASGWVVLGVDPLRQSGNRRHGNAPERRLRQLPFAASA